jgi:cell division protein FtsB
MNTRRGRFSARLLGFALVALTLNALIGERGLIERRRAELQATKIAAELTSLRRENSELRRRVAALTSDPLAIEHIARAKLGLVRPGEMLVLLRTARPR